MNHQWLPSKLIQGGFEQDETSEVIIGDVKIPTIFVVSYWCPDCLATLHLNDDFVWEYQEHPDAAPIVRIQNEA